MLARMQRNWITHPLLWECEVVQPLREIVWQFLNKTTLDLPFNPAIEYLGIYPREIKSYVYT